MIRIAVIDDDKTVLCDMHKRFDRFIIAYDFDFTVEYFSSCEDIYVKFKAGEKYDLLFLDIEFPEMKGTEFGLQLRRQMKNYDTQIVFISTIRDYAMELFKIRPIAFLIKPITYEDLCKCLQDYMLDYSNSDSFLEYISENTKHKIKLKEVLYLESNGKKVIFHTKTEEFAVNGKISSIIEGNGSKFLCISRGVYVNIKHIIKATSKEVTLEDGTSLFISRGQQSIVRDRLSEL